MSIFEKATRQKLRFKGANGNITTEDLWGKSLADLDEIAKGLHKEVNESTVSFISEKKGDSETALKFEVVKHIITVKLSEKAAREQATKNAERKQQILAQLAARDAQKLDAMSEEQLRAELNSLG